MKKGDLIIIFIIILFIGLMLSPWTAGTFRYLSSHFPYSTGFVKFAVLATIGEMLAIRIVSGEYRKPHYLFIRIFIWGFVGILIVFNFALYEDGIRGILERGLLPSLNYSPVYVAFLIASAMNLTFGPAFMAVHRISDAYLANKAEGKCGLASAVKRVDWNSFMTFVVGKTIPFFWIPAHTVTFLLPSVYRVFVAAMLSIALGLILAFATLRKNSK